MTIPGIRYSIYQKNSRGCSGWHSDSERGECTLNRRLNRVYEKAPVLNFPDSAKLVFMSDCHRGVGNGNDNFEQNQNLCFSALQYYYENGFIYFELGDGEELWENRKLSQIIAAYGNIYWLMKKFYEDNRLFMIYGNHDDRKKNEKYVRRNYAYFYNECKNCREPLFPGIDIREAYRIHIMDFELFLLTVISAICSMIICASLHG